LSMLTSCRPDSTIATFKKCHLPKRFIDSNLTYRRELQGAARRFVKHPKNNFDSGTREIGQDSPQKLNHVQGRLAISFWKDGRGLAFNSPADPFQLHLSSPSGHSKLLWSQVT
jgi:hypothetical protein